MNIHEIVYKALSGGYTRREDEQHQLLFDQEFRADLVTAAYNTGMSMKLAESLADFVEENFPQVHKGNQACLFRGLMTTISNHVLGR